MCGFVKSYVHYVDGINRFVGRGCMYLIFVMMGVLLFSAVSRFFFNHPILWAVEFTQFVMAAYFMVGGGFALLLGSHVRMDVFYSKWTRRKQARMDVATAIFLFAYLALLLYGCCTSAWYSIIFHQHNNSAWAPALAPIKIIMGCGIVLTILQSVSEFFKAYAFAKGETIGEEIPERILLERVPFLWNRFSFLHKVSIRNIVRYKKRLYMMLLGIGGCTALIVSLLPACHFFFCLVEMKGSPHV